MVMFNGEIKTYLDVRRFVEASFGTLDNDSELQFLVMAGNVLQQMWADIRRSPFFLSSWTVLPTSGDFLIPDDLALAKSIEGTLEDDSKVMYSLHTAGCAGSAGCVRPMNTVSYDCSPPGTKGTATIEGARIVPSDEPVSLEICGYRSPAKALFTYDEEEQCRTWLNIDMPAEYRSVFAKAVVGMMFFACGDAAKGADWLSLSNTEFSSLKSAHGAGIAGDRQVQAMYRLGSKRYISAGSCCNPGENWRYML
jgi:hypothetical protein